MEPENPLRRRCHALAAALCFTPAPAAQPWQQYADLAKAGWATEDLEAARKFAAKIGSAAVFIVDRGHVVAAWGAIDHPFKAASVRKSLYDAAIGATHLAAPFDIHKTLGQLGIEDRQPLTASEKTATLEHLMMSRSGVYLPAAFEPAANARLRPARGSAKPGTAWFYNNWDFNAVCPAFHAASGTTMREALLEHLAQPLGMEDFAVAHVFDYLEPRASRHPAMTIRISARDLARVGQLYLHGGRWGDRQLIAKSWVERSIHPHTTFAADHPRGAGNGYGRMWWVLPARPGRFSPYGAQRRIAASGTGGQYLVLLPKLDLLIVHLADTDRGRGVSSRDRHQLLDRILRARESGPGDAAATGPLRVQKLQQAAPAPLRTDLRKIPEGDCARFSGRFMFTETMGVRLYALEDRLFCQPLGMPVHSDAELLLAADGTLRSPVVSLVLRPVRGEDTSITGVQVQFQGRTTTGKRAGSR